MELLLVDPFVRLSTLTRVWRILRSSARGRIPGAIPCVSTGRRRPPMASQALVYLADSILYLSSLLRDQPRQIDRYIDYFGGELQVAFAPTRPRRRRA